MFFERISSSFGYHCGVFRNMILRGNARSAAPGVLLFLLILTPAALSAQQPAVDTPGLPPVVQIDEVSIKSLLTPSGRPLLVNFWATWCVPCVEEFPLLVQINEEYKGKIDFVTISLDDLAEIKRDVPRFLSQQNATMPAYLLYTPDEDIVIRSISEKWSGGLPFTILFGADGETLYSKQGIIKPELLKPKIDGAVVVKECKPPEQ